jgi:DNA helicase-2/ATP-dependent DNA helicase PcrA
LILPTESILKFLKGIKKPFGASSTGVSQNKLYVAITRAQYSVAFIVDDKFFSEKMWKS